LVEERTPLPSKGSVGQTSYRENSGGGQACKSGVQKGEKKNRLVGYQTMRVGSQRNAPDERGWGEPPGPALSNTNRPQKREMVSEKTELLIVNTQRGVEAMEAPPR